MAKYKSYRKEVEAKLNKAELKALKLIGAMVSSEASEIARDKGVFDTGRLVQSMGNEIYDTDKKFVRVGNSVEYAIFHELSSSKMPARPFLQPAVDENRNDIKKIAEDALREALK